jgi:hypothetical protein
MEQKDLKHIVDQFEIQGNVTEVKPLGNGLINTTYKAPKVMPPTMFSNMSTTPFSPT